MDTSFLAQWVEPENRIGNPALGNSLSGFTGAGFIARLVSMLITLALIAGAVAFVFVLLLGAISWITSGGDKAKVETARARVATGIVGLVVLLATWAIIRLIQQIFNINILTLDILNLAIQ